MIVLDEQIHGPSIVEPIAAWYSGRVISITTLRPKTVIEDDAIPVLLRTALSPTFVTINVSDFWRVAPADPRYAIICIELPARRVLEIPDWLRRLFRLSIFKTKTTRMGTIARVRPNLIEFYKSDQRVQTIGWND